MKVDRVGIIGGGIMGAGIVEVCARAGLHVTLVETNGIRAADAVDRVQASMRRAVQRGKLAGDAAEKAQARIEARHDLEAVVDCELVVEAVVEDRATWSMPC